MEIIEANYQPRVNWTNGMRGLKVKYGYIVAPIEKRRSLQVIASKLKKKEGIEIQIRRCDDELHIWRIK